MPGAGVMAGPVAAMAPGAKITPTAFTDNFNRADGNPGQPWYSPLCGEGLEIHGNVLTASVDQQGGSVGVLLDSDDLDISFDVQYSPAPTTSLTSDRDDVQVSFKGSACWTQARHYLWATQPNPSLPGGGSHGMSIYQVDYDGTNYTFTSIAFVDNGDILPGGSYHIRIRTVGTSVLVYKDYSATPYLTASISALPGQRAVWFSCQQRDTTYFDNININKVTGTWGTLSLPYFNTFTGSFDTTWASNDGSTWGYDGNGNLKALTLNNGSTTYDGSATAILFADAGVEDIDITLKWGALTSTLHFSGFYFNYLDANNYWMVRGDGGAAQIHRVVGGVAHYVGNGNTTTGSISRIILSNGQVFGIWTRTDGFMDLELISLGPAIPGGTRVGFFTYDVGNSFAEITLQQPFYYNNVGSLASGGASYEADAGSQLQCTIFRITSDAGSDLTQGWSYSDNSRAPDGSSGVRLQPADTTSASDYVLDFRASGYTIAHGYTHTSPVVWWAQMTYRNQSQIWRSTDGVNWTQMGNFPNGLSYPEEYASTNTHYWLATGRNTYDNIKVWAFSPVFVRDSFDRSNNSSSMGSADTGQNWVTSLGVLGINGNQAYSPYTAGQFSVGLIDSNHADIVTRSELKLSSVRVNAGLVTRANDYNNCIYAAIGSGSSVVSLLKRVGGTQTVLASAPYTAPLGAMVSMELIASGSTIKVKINGVTKITYTLTSGEAASFLGSATKQGIEIYTDSAAAGGDDGGTQWNDYRVSVV